MLSIKDGEFKMDGKSFRIYSGSMHYFRIMPEYWEDRLRKLKAAGFNTVETYVCWNMHEPRKGEFDFTGRFDIRRFIKTAQEVGLYAIVRPGPYICAEWDMVRPLDSPTAFSACASMDWYTSDASSLPFPSASPSRNDGSAVSFV